VLPAARTCVFRAVPSIDRLIDSPKTACNCQEIVRESPGAGPEEGGGFRPGWMAEGVRRGRDVLLVPEAVQGGHSAEAPLREVRAYGRVGGAWTHVGIGPRGGVSLMFLLCEFLSLMLLSFVLLVLPPPLPLLLLLLKGVLLLSPLRPFPALVSYSQYWGGHGQKRTSRASDAHRWS